MAEHSAEYPRPDFIHGDCNWTSLNGEWDFIFDDADVGVSKNWYKQGFLPDSANSSQEAGNGTEPASSDVAVNNRRKIIVPFAWQTPASSVNVRASHEVFWYHRKLRDGISKEEHWPAERRLFLRFGAVDYETTAWVNGQKVGFHRGGHVSFKFDITDAVTLHAPKDDGDHSLYIRVRDSPSDLTQPRGKQYWEPISKDIFYKPTSGIWQNVWLETLPTLRIGDSSEGTIVRSNDLESGILNLTIATAGRSHGQKCSAEAKVTLKGVELSTAKSDFPESSDSLELDLDMSLSPESLDAIRARKSNIEAGQLMNDVAVWQPEHPVCYDVVLRLFDAEGNVLDEVSTYTAMRSIEWRSGDETFRLNGRPYFQALVLDQGYWPDTGLTPPSANHLKADIELAKKMGFNGCRKHQKVEDPIFLYWADKLGYLVWGEMASAYEFSAEYVERFNEEWTAAVLRDRNHPCIVAWTPANESWAYTNLKESAEQRDHLRSLYSRTRNLDPTRPVNDNCGWEHVVSDLLTFHEYADSASLAEVCASMEGVHRPKSGRDVVCKALPGARDDVGRITSERAPVICTEFGGVNIRAGVGAAAGERDWGYTTASDAADLLERFAALARAVVQGGLCCGFVYTQLTDIEQEVNGLLTFDRRPKLDVDKVREIVEGAKTEYYALSRKNNPGAWQG